MLFVKERPPLRLEVGVTTPSGNVARWGADDPDPSRQPQDISFSTAMPGGFESWSCTLQRDPRRAWADLEELSRVQIRGVGGQIAFEGRLETLPDTGGGQAQISPAGSGYQAALQDNSSAAMIYLDQDLSNWEGPSLARQIALTTANFQIGSNSVGADPTNNDPALILEIDDSWASPYKPLTEAWYDAGVAAPVAGVYYQYTPGVQINSADTNWEISAALSIDDVVSADENQAMALAGATGILSPGTPHRYALIQQSYGDTPAGTSGATYQSYWNLAVLGNHGLPIQGSWPASIGILASDVAAHAVGTWAPEITFTTGPNGTIQPSAFAIPQLTFTTPTTASAIIAQAIQYELLDWAVWEGPTYWQNPFGTSAKTRNWRCRIGDCQLQETGPDITRIFNSVVVQFTNVDGTNGTVGPPGSGAQTTDPSLVDSDPQNPANQAGITKCALVTMGTSTPAAAIQVGAQYLTVQAQLDTSGQASIIGHCQDDAGVWHAAWEMRAGDTLSVIDASDSSPRRIVSTSYDDSSKTNSVQLDVPPDTNTALLERLSAAISPLGLS